MTTQKIHTCAHCRAQYTYFPSTYNFEPTYNDSSYCPECFEVIEKALEKIPVRFKKRFIPTNDYTKEQIVDAQNKRLGVGLQARRVLPGLFDKENFSVQEKICEMMLDPQTNSMHYYSVSWWPKRPEEVEIRKEVWWDIKTNCIAKDREI